MVGLFRTLKAFSLVCGLVAASAQAADEPLSVTAAQSKATGSATASVHDGAVLLRLDNPAGDSVWKLLPPDGKPFWNFEGWKYFAVDVENLSDSRQLRLDLAVRSVGENKKGKDEQDLGIALNPHEKGTMRLPLAHSWLYKMPEGIPGPRAIDTAKIQYLTFSLRWPFEKASKGLVNCRLSSFRLEEPLKPDSAAAPVNRKKFFPFIDAYGQYSHSDWPEKIHSDADLLKFQKEEQAKLAATERISNWDEYGGWRNGPQLEATGSFRTEKYEGKWYLVDPAGRLFFSQGMDVLIACTDPIRTEGHEKWFENAVPVAGHWQPTDRCLRVKYGTDDYLPAFYATLAKRLECWGFNTIGNWGKADLMALGKTPYVLQLTDYDAKMPRLGKLKFYDVFNKVYLAKMRNLIVDGAKRDPIFEKSLTDPLCIGYFIDNELNFGDGGRQAYTNTIIEGPATMAAKIKFVEWLEQRYASVERLNASWKTDYKDWNALLDTVKAPKGEGYLLDAEEFFKVVVDQYFKVCRDAVKSVAPNRLYLGCRFISTDAVRPVLYEACAKYCDVLSVNIYAHTPANFPSAGFPDIPVLIGEFHFGVGDRGMFSPSLCLAGVTEADRARAYQRFLQGALAHPNIVGAHWFQFRNQPLTGRWDGEGHQLGFVDVADTPYEEMTAASREVGANMYDYRTKGKLANSMSQGR